ncbi:OmpA family protein [bacterium]|nr:OmpA family protein [bacterium]
MPANRIVTAMLAICGALLLAPLPSFATSQQIGQFPEELRDSDGDGVADIDDNCPATAGVRLAALQRLNQPVDRCGCPLDDCSTDFDGDGVADCNDLCPTSLRGWPVDAKGCPTALQTTARIRLDVKFATARANLLPGYRVDLAEMARLLRHYDDLIVVLEGHTDSRGSDLYNAELSKTRAHVVRRELLGMGGIDPSRVIAVGFGESSPIASNNTVNGRVLNRRVVAEVRIPGTIKPSDIYGDNPDAGAKPAAPSNAISGYRGRNGRSVNR